MNVPVSFELAKLLKEKGFKSKNPYYNSFGEIVKTPDIPDNDYRHTNNMMQRFRWEAPAIAEVVCWLYEKHGIWISVFGGDGLDKFSYTIATKERWYWGDGNMWDNKSYNSPTEAYENAIKYTLTKLI